MSMKVLNGLDLGSKKITSLATPTATTDAASKGYVDSVPIAGFCGDGSGGNVTISGTTTLTGDAFYDTLTVQSGGILITAGYRIHCKTLCQVDSGGTIRCNGADATSATGATATGNQTITGGGAGANGNTGVGSTATGLNNAYGSAGGAGGAGVSAGGAGGTVALFGNPGVAHSLPQLALGYFMGTNGSGAQQIVGFFGGGGGGGGGGDATNAGGGGGAGGGVLLINARTVINNGTISANGGAGRSTAVGNTGGGGGGGGGVVIVNTTSFTGTTPTATGGNGGTKTGTGVNGTAGTTGRILVNTWI